MGLSDALGYHHRTANPAHRAVRWLAGTRPVAWVFSRTLRHLDDAVSRLSRGRHSAPGLLAIPVDGMLALLGTNFGQGATPAWVHNLETDPRARVSYRGTSTDVVARPAAEEEAAQVMAAAGFYPGYAKYRERIGDRRRVRIFVLEAA